MIGADKRRGKQALLLQLAIGLAIAAVLMIFGQRLALSALAGASIAFLGSLLFTVMVFSGYSAGDPGALARRLYLAEAVKLVAVIAAFAVLFSQWRDVAVLPLFVTFLFVYLVPGVIVSWRTSGGA